MKGWLKRSARLRMRAKLMDLPKDWQILMGFHWVKPKD